MPPLPKHLNLWPENVSFLKTFITLTYIWMRKTDIPQNESLLCVEDVTKLLVCFFFVLLGYFPLESTDHGQNTILHDTLPMDHRNISAPLNLSTRLQFHLKWYSLVFSHSSAVRVAFLLKQSSWESKWCLGFAQHWERQYSWSCLALLFCEARDLGKGFGEVYTEDGVLSTLKCWKINSSFTIRSTKLLQFSRSTDLVLRKDRQVWHCTGW